MRSSARGFTEHSLLPLTHRLTRTSLPTRDPLPSYPTAPSSPKARLIHRPATLPGRRHTGHAVCAAKPMTVDGKVPNRMSERLERGDTVSRDADRVTELSTAPHRTAKGAFFFSSRRRHTRLTCDWSSDVCSSD